MSEHSEDRRLLEQLHFAVDQYLEYPGARRWRLMLVMVEAANHLGRSHAAWDPAHAKDWPKGYEQTVHRPTSTSYWSRPEWGPN